MSGAGGELLEPGVDRVDPLDHRLHVGLRRRWLPLATDPGGGLGSGAEQRADSDGRNTEAAVPATPLPALTLRELPSAMSSIVRSSAARLASNAMRSAQAPRQSEAAGDCAADFGASTFVGSTAST